MFICVCGCVHRIQKRGLNPLELQLQVVMNHSAWMLGTKL